MNDTDPPRMWAVVQLINEVSEVLCLCRSEDDARAIVAAVDVGDIPFHYDVEPYPIASVDEGILVLRNR